MIKAKLIAPAVAAAAIGGFAMFDKNEDSNESNPFPYVENTFAENVSDQLEDPTVIGNKAAIENKLATQPQQFLSNPPAVPLEQVIRFDVYPSWVKSQWQRVSAISAQPGLRGMRVALVTGTMPTDLTGSLTYYFDDTHRVQKIEFVGRTDDATSLVNILTGQHQFHSYRSLDAGLYVAGNRRKPSGLLKLSHPPTIRTTQTGQVLVFLEITKPSSRFGLGPRARQVLAEEGFVKTRRFGF